MDSLRTNINGNVYYNKPKLSEFQKFWKKIIDNKYIYVISIAICLTGAYLKNKYTTPVYLVESSILVKEGQNVSNNPGNLLLPKEGESNGSNKVFDISEEIALLKSYPFILKVVDSLNFRISYFSKSDVGSDELYGELLPFKASFPDTSKMNILTHKTFRISFPDQQHYILKEINEDDSTGNTKIYKLKDIAIINGCPLKIDLTSYFNSKQDINHDFELFIWDIQDLALYFKNYLSVSAGYESRIMDIGLTTPLPEKGIDFLNELAKQYLNVKYEEKSRSASQALAFINEQINAVGSSLARKENDLASFKSSNAFSDASDMTSRNLDVLTQFDNERASLMLNERYYSSILNDLNKSSGLDQLIAPAAIGIEDGLTDNLINQLTELQIERKSYSTIGSSKNPLVQELDNKINHVKNALKENIQNLANNNRTKLAQINARSSQFKSNVRKIPIEEKKFTDIKRAGEFDDELYRLLMQKRIEAGILKASATVENKVIEPAMLASSVPLEPKKNRNYFYAFIIGFALPFGFIQLRNAMNKRIAGKDEIYNITTIPVLGTIYHNLDSSPFAITQTSRSAVSESLRILRSNIMHFIKDQSTKVFLFTSLDSGEGKSFISFNIALSFALAKKKTILVNLDLRVPNKAYKNLGKSDIGITSYLNDEVSIKEIIQETAYSCLDFISTVDLPANPAELLSEDKLKALFDYLRVNYDYIIIDSPPLGIVAEPFILAKHSDLNIIVVREHYTTRDGLFELEQLYTEGKIKNVAMVVNDVRLNRKDYKNIYYYKSTNKKNKMFDSKITNRIWSSWHGPKN